MTEAPATVGLFPCKTFTGLQDRSDHLGHVSAYHQPQNQKENLDFLSLSPSLYTSPHGFPYCTLCVMTLLLWDYPHPIAGNLTEKSTPGPPSFPLLCRPRIKLFKIFLKPCPKQPSSQMLRHWVSFPPDRSSTFGTPPSHNLRTPDPAMKRIPVALFFLTRHRHSTEALFPEGCQAAPD